MSQSTTLIKFLHDLVEAILDPLRYPTTGQPAKLVPLACLCLLTAPKACRLSGMIGASYTVFVMDISELFNSMALANLSLELMSLACSAIMSSDIIRFGIKHGSIHSI